MKLYPLLSFTAIVVMSLAAPSSAETELGISGQIRVRSEFDDRLLGNRYAGKTYTEMRTRVNIDALVDDNTQAFVQFQDSRTFGGYNQFGSRQSGTLNDGKNVDIHQAYIKVKRIWYEGWGAQVGRFEVNLGNQRVFGSVGWSNVGRAWEGAQVWYGDDQLRATAFTFKAREANYALRNRDFDIFGLHLDVVNPNLEFLASYEYDADTVGAAAVDSNDLDRITLGVYYRHQSEQVDVEFNGAYQTGKIFDLFDIAAFMFAGEIGYLFPGEGKARLAAGVDYVSGDDDASDTDFKAYDNLYYTAHKFRGYMDYFVTSNSEGLVDIMLRGKVVPSPGWLIRGDFHLFMTAQSYVNPLDATQTTNDVGMEVDLTAELSMIEGINLTGGASFFFAKDSWAGVPDPEIGVWLYTMATVNFK